MPTGVLVERSIALAVLNAVVTLAAESRWRCSRRWPSFSAVVSEITFGPPTLTADWRLHSSTPSPYRRHWFCGTVGGGMALRADLRPVGAARLHIGGERSEFAEAPAPAAVLAATEQLVLTPLVKPLTVMGEAVPFPVMRRRSPV